MTKKRKLHDLKGIINHCLLGKINSKGKHYQSSFYYLEIKSEGLFTPRKELIIYAFANLVSKDIWKALEQRTFADKQYLFWCEKRTRGWRLINWQEIS